ncbi:hypothetical protein IUQ79_20795 [Mycobacteroides abscessus subsp. bolletii]|uniref:hypothetical protein n=1 Tax=Mycobacteroides abscessus TaxID=36809 RepID=UPI0019D04871|nr:hypothetical protein [Mycobacteroides abscessus]MBN7304338.1 hypothetical protein [Mycobacteroides abscessus subsp. bolletii]
MTAKDKPGIDWETAAAVNEVRLRVLVAALNLFNPGIGFYHARTVLCGMPEELPRWAVVAIAAQLAREVAGRHGQPITDATVDDLTADELLADFRRQLLRNQGFGAVSGADADDAHRALTLAGHRYPWVIAAVSRKLLEEDDIQASLRCLDQLTWLIYTVACWDTGDPASRINGFINEVLDRRRWLVGQAMNSTTERNHQ